MHRRRTRLASLAALAFLAGCRPQPGPDGNRSSDAAAAPIVIGAVFPLSAGAGRIGQMKREGADLAADHINASGGVNGRPLAIHYADSRNSTTEAGIAFAKLVDVDRAPVIMSAMSQVSLSLVPAAERAQVVLFANASHPELPRRSRWVFRNLPNTAQTATVMAQTAYRQLRLRRVVTLAINDEYGAEAARIFDTSFSGLGGKVVAADSFELAGTDFRAQLRKLAAAEPEAWWIPGYGTALGLILKQKSELRLPGQVLCDLGLVDDNVLKTAGPAADHAYVVAPAFDEADPREAVQRFVRDYRERYHAAPSFDAAFQYDAVYLIADAIRRATSPTGPAIRDALAATEGFVGVCGPTAFDQDGEARLEVAVSELIDGRLTAIERSGQSSAARPTSTPTDESGLE